MSDEPVTQEEKEEEKENEEKQEEEEEEEEQREQEEQEEQEKEEEVDLSQYRDCDMCHDIIHITTALVLPHCPLEGFDICFHCLLGKRLEQEACVVIDRTASSEEEKPRIWPCWMCGKLLGGGHSWHCSQLASSCFSRGIDICNDCYGQPPTVMLRQRPSLPCAVTE